MLKNLNTMKRIDSPIKGIFIFEDEDEVLNHNL